MRVSVIFLLFSAFFIFKGRAFYYCHVEQNIAEQWEQLKLNNTYKPSTCCEISEEQWELISWYFLRVGSHINVTEIVREVDFDKQTLYMSHFVKDLHLHTGLEYYTHQIRYNVQNKQTDKKDIFNDNTYQWHPELSKYGNSTYYVEEDKLNIRAQILKKNWNREDEPASGSVVLATNIKIIDHFLSDRKSKHPFQSKRTYYVILIYREPLIEDDNWDRLASRILAKLWKVHGILNAIVLATCRQNSVGIFDPFANTRQLNITDPNIDEWGIYRSFPIKYIDYTDNWIIQKAYSLNGFPLTVSIFEREPTMVSKIPKYFGETHYARGMKMSGYGGIDGFLLGSLSKEMNFTVNAIMPKDIYTNGYKVGGEFTGALGDVLYGRADIAFNSRFLINYDTSDIEFMSPILGDMVCVVIPAARKTPQWKAIFKCFDGWFWATFFVITASASVIFAVLKYYQEKQERRVLRESLLYRDFKSFVVEEEIRVKDIISATWQAMIGMTMVLPFGTIERLLIGSCLVANIIIGGAFEGSLYTAYTKTTSVNIDTLSELDSSGLRITASSPYLRNTFGNKQTGSEILRSLSDKIFFKSTADLDALDRVIEYRDVCSIERHSDVYIMMRTKYMDNDGNSKLHVIKECPRHHFLTYIVHKDWPLLYRFNRVLQRLSEGGFGHLWYEKSAEAFIMHSYVQNQTQQQEKRRKPFSLQDIQAPFYVLIIGYIISFVVFLIEKFVLTPEKLYKLKSFIWPVKNSVNDFENSHRNRSKKLYRNRKHLKA